LDLQKYKSICYIILSSILVAWYEYSLSGLLEVIFIFRPTSLLESSIKLSLPVGLSVLVLKEMVVRNTVEHRDIGSMFHRNGSVRLQEDTRSKPMRPQFK
jgi:hypothetical protein